MAPGSNGVRAVAELLTRLVDVVKASLGEQSDPSVVHGYVRDIRQTQPHPIGIAGCGLVVGIDLHLDRRSTPYVDQIGSRLDRKCQGEAAGVERAVVGDRRSHRNPRCHPGGSSPRWRSLRMGCQEPSASWTAAPRWRQAQPGWQVAQGDAPIVEAGARSQIRHHHLDVEELLQPLGTSRNDDPKDGRGPAHALRITDLSDNLVAIHTEGDRPTATTTLDGATLSIRDGNSDTANDWVHDSRSR